MSAYGPQMDREYSTQSLPSRGVSEMGSRYAVESGFYMSSFAAAIFIGGLIIVGILLITMVVALAVMLQSCQNRSSGVVEIVKSSDDCKILTLHAELNSLEADDFPSICWAFAIRYIEEGLYAKDLYFTMRLAESYFNTLTPSDDGLDVVLVDMDDIFNLSPRCTKLLMNRIDQCGGVDGIEEANHLKQRLILKLLMSLQASGWPVILISRKHEGHRNATSELLISTGYRGWSSLIMRLDDEMQMDSREYFSRRRAIIEKEGFHIIGLISSKMDALTGQNLGKRVFKIPNPLYYNIQHLAESRKIA